MPLTEAQVAKARTFPGCGDLTADNAVDRLFAAAESIQNVASNTTTENTRLAADNTRLTGELTAASAKIPQALPAPVLKTMASATRVYVQSAIDKQALTPAVANAMAERFIGKDDNLNVAMLTPDATGDCPATAMFSILAGNGAAPAVGKQPGGQPSPKATPGAPEEKKPMTPERKKELLALSGVGTNDDAA